MCIFCLKFKVSFLLTSNSRYTKKNVPNEPACEWLGTLFNLHSSSQCILSSWERRRENEKPVAINRMCANDDHGWVQVDSMSQSHWLDCLNGRAVCCPLHTKSDLQLQIVFPFDTLADDSIAVCTIVKYLHKDSVIRRAKRKHWNQLIQSCLVLSKQEIFNVVRLNRFLLCFFATYRAHNWESRRVCWLIRFISAIARFGCLLGGNGCQLRETR